MTDEGANILAQCVEANVRSLGEATNRVLRRAKDAGIRRLAEAFADLYDTLEQIPDNIRTVQIERLLNQHATIRNRAESIIDPMEA